MTETRELTTAFVLNFLVRTISRCLRRQSPSREYREAIGKQLMIALGLKLGDREGLAVASHV